MDNNKENLPLYLRYKQRVLDAKVSIDKHVPITHAPLKKEGCIGPDCVKAKKGCGCGRKKNNIG